MAATALLLSACGAKKPSLYSNPAQWGNYKCMVHSEDGRSFVGWSVSRARARSNALTICKDQTGESACQLDACNNAVIEKDLD